MPQISVIVPVYRAEKTLEACVNSVLAQTFGDWELILVDDGSDDESGRMCDAFSAADARIKVIHQQNAGVSAARNAGIAEASGDWIAFLDSDDWLEPQMYETLLNELHKTGADTAGCGHWNVFPSGKREAEGGVLPAGTYGPEEIRTGVVEPLLRDRIGGRSAPLNGYVWRFLFRSRIILEHEIFFSGAYLEDEVFLIAYFCRAERLAMTDEPLYCYFQNPASVTRKYMPDFIGAFRASFDAKRKLVEECNIESVGGWEINTCWAGLLIGVANIFAPGNKASFSEKREQLRKLCREPEFYAALQYGHPRNAGKNKQIVIDLLSARMFYPLALLYRWKNRGR